MERRSAHRKADDDTASDDKKEEAKKSFKWVGSDEYVN